MYASSLSFKRIPSYMSTRVICWTLFYLYSPLDLVTSLFTPWWHVGLRSIRTTLQHQPSCWPPNRSSQLDCLRRILPPFLTILFYGRLLDRLCIGDVGTRPYCALSRPFNLGQSQEHQNRRWGCACQVDEKLPRGAWLVVLGILFACHHLQYHGDWGESSSFLRLHSTVIGSWSCILVFRSITQGYQCGHLY